VAVPAEVLGQVPPVLLVRLLHHLNPHTTPPATAEQANTGSLGQPIPQVTAIHATSLNLLPLTCAAQHASSRLQAHVAPHLCSPTCQLTLASSCCQRWLLDEKNHASHAEVWWRSQGAHSSWAQYEWQHIQVSVLIAVRHADGRQCQNVVHT
jgi:hypothetical protein